MVQEKQLQLIIERSMKDEHFRKQLMENPKQILETEFGMKFPESVKVNVVEEDPQTFYVVLPPNPVAGKAGELSDTDLESVAGGTVGGEYTSPEYSCLPCQN